MSLSTIFYLLHFTKSLFFSEEHRSIKELRIAAGPYLCCNDWRRGALGVIHYVYVHTVAAESLFSTRQLVII